MNNENSFDHNYGDIFSYRDRIKTLKYNTKNNNFEFKLRYINQIINFVVVDNNIIYLKNVSDSLTDQIIFSLETIQSTQPTQQIQPTQPDNYIISTNKFSLNDDIIDVFKNFNVNIRNITSNNWIIKYNKNKTISIVQQIGNTTKNYLVDFNETSSTDDSKNIYLILQYSIPQDKNNIGLHEISIPKYNIKYDPTKPINSINSINFSFFNTDFTNIDSGIKMQAIKYDLYSTFGNNKIKSIEYSIYNGFTLTSYLDKIYNYNASILNYNNLIMILDNVNSFVDGDYIFLYEGVYFVNNRNLSIKYSNILCNIDTNIYDFNYDVNKKKIIYIDNSNNNLLNFEFEYIVDKTSSTLTNVSNDLQTRYSFKNYTNLLLNKFNQEKSIFTDTFVYINDD